MTFKAIAAKLQDELAEIIKSGTEINEYELIVYKYVFISELKIPVHEELGIRVTDDAFVLHVIPDDLEFCLLEKLVNAFDRFEARFKANEYNIIKLEFVLCDYV